MMMKLNKAFGRRLISNEKGNALLEFAFVAPVFSGLIMGAMDLGHTQYMRDVLQGQVQKAARDSALENGASPANAAAIDQRIRDQVLNLAKGATIDISRRYYRTFEDASTAQAEPFTDTDGDTSCNHGEPFQDNNNNGVRDSDGGDGGQGGAKDKVLYTVAVSYPRLFPVAGLLGMSDHVNLKATTVLSNQPYGDQANYTAPSVGHCT
jgi:Flp pilus assembly protein TadG